MRVTAKVMGQYKGHMQDPGTVFEIADKDLCWWMQEVKESYAPEPPATSIQPTPEIQSKELHGNEKES